MFLWLEEEEIEGPFGMYMHRVREVFLVETRFSRAFLYPTIHIIVIREKKYLSNYQKIKSSAKLKSYVKAPTKWDTNSKIESNLKMKIENDKILLSPHNLFLILGKISENFQLLKLSIILERAEYVPITDDITPTIIIIIQTQTYKNKRIIKCA